MCGHNLGWRHDGQAGHGNLFLQVRRNPTGGSAVYWLLDVLADRGWNVRVAKQGQNFAVLDDRSRDLYPLDTNGIFAAVQHSGIGQADFGNDHTVSRGNMVTHIRDARVQTCGGVHNSRDDVVGKFDMDFIQI